MVDLDVPRTLLNKIFVFNKRRKCEQKIDRPLWYILHVGIPL